MKPAEEAVANKLRQRLTEFRDVHQLMHEFKRYNELMKRPNIAEALRSEREQFLGQLANYVKVKASFKERKYIYILISMSTRFRSEKSSMVYILNILVNKQQIIWLHLIHSLQALNGDFRQSTQDGTGRLKGKNLTETVGQIVWVRQIEAKVC